MKAKRMKPDAWMPLYIGDYLKDTMHLDAEGHGAYLMLIIAYWAKGGPIPANDDWLRNVAKVRDASWARVKGMLLPFFTQENGHLRHKRIDAELIEASELMRVRSEAGKAGNKARWGLATASQPDADAIATASQKNPPSPSPISTHTRDAEIPSLEEVKTYGATIGVSESVCQAFYDHHEGNNIWVNEHNRAKNWKHKLKVWNENNRASSKRPGHKPAKSRNDGTYNDSVDPKLYEKLIKSVSNS